MEGENFTKISISKTTIEWVGIFWSYEVIWEGIPDGTMRLEKKNFMVLVLTIGKEILSEWPRRDLFGLGMKNQRNLDNWNYEQYWNT